MTRTQEHIRDEFQRQLDAAVPGSTLVLETPLERPGPVAVRKRITLDGGGCTIWGWSGPVVRVSAANVTLKNLRIEYTADETDNGVALQTDAPGLALENVTVRGAVVGLKAEEGEWRYPAQLYLGTLAPRVAHTLTVRIAVPVPCQLSCNVSGLRLEPGSLTPGMHEIRFFLDEMMPETLVYGTLAIQTAFLRREITLNGRVQGATDGLSPPTGVPNRVVWAPADWDRLFVTELHGAVAATSVPISLTPMLPRVQPRTDIPVATLLTGPLIGPVIDLIPEPVPAAQPAALAPARFGAGTGLVQVPPEKVISKLFTQEKVAGDAQQPTSQPEPLAPTLGAAFGAPPTPPPPVEPPEPLPPDVTAEAEKKSTSSVRMKPKSSLFGPSPVPPTTPASVPPTPCPSLPVRKIRPAGTVPGWALPPAPPPPTG